MALIDKSSITRRVKYLPQIGTVALGIKKQNAQGVDYPASAGHFVFKTKDTLWQQVLMECYGEKPTRLFVTIPDTEISDYVHNVYQLRKNNKIFAETDDVNLWKIEDGKYVLVDPAKIETKEVGGLQGAKDMLAASHSAEWKETLMVQFFVLPTKRDEETNQFIMPFSDTVLTLGVFRMYTSGKESIDNILSTLQMARMSAYFALDYEMKKTEKGTFPVIKLIPIIQGNLGSQLLSNGSNFDQPAPALSSGDDQSVYPGHFTDLEDDENVA